MSKTIQDYREIVKVLKLQLLKIRQQNISLSKTLGISSQNQTSSFSPRLDKLKNNPKQFAKHLYLFNIFGHKCELLGVSPQMVFRIADKKRDKKVSTTDLSEIMKRLKLKFDDTEITRFLSTITKSGNIFYEQYLQYLNAFQINSEKYPPKGQRTYSQICLLRFGMEIRSNSNNITASQLCKQINSKDGGPYLSFESFTSYCKNKTKLKDVEIIGSFVALDTQSQCQLDKQNFIREMNKVFDLVQRGVNLDQESSKIQVSKFSRRPQVEKESVADDDFKIEDQTGVEKAIKAKKQPKKEVKLVKGDMNKLVQQMKKQGISASNVITKLLEKEQKRKLVRPFSLNDFSGVIQQINKNVNKKKIIQFYKAFDTGNNGSISTDELVKLWLEGKEATDPAQILFKLLARHMKEIQSQQYITKFSTSGFDANDVVKFTMLGDVFSGLQLKEDYLRIIESLLPTNCLVSKLVTLMETGTGKQSPKVFKPMSKKDYQNYNIAVKSLVPKESKNFPKLIRLEKGAEKSLDKQYWETIFTDQWSCWSYCLQTAAKLTSYWRDPQFGPNNGDTYGYRSIVGNESTVPPGLPAEDQICWRTFEEVLQKQGRTVQEVKLFPDNLVANDIIQGKLGDCWYVSSLSIVTSNDEYVVGKSQKQCLNNPQVSLAYGVHPKMFHFFRQYGLYVFKFFKGFKPVYVAVDDLFPVQISTNELIFAHSPDPGLQWVAFLEKAYAKLHHCYSNMISGDISQGLSDLTNALPVKEDLTNNNPEELLQKVSKLTSEGQLMGCSINVPKNAGVEQPVTLDDERTGLFYGHAYSIQDYINILPKSQDFKLMRVRNPWGHGQWMLDWSDKPLNSDPDYAKLNKYQGEIDKFYESKIETAKKMRENYAQITKYRPNQDGEFLMNFYDFAKIFSNLFTGYNFKGKEYTCYSLEGKWDKSMPSGVCKIKGSTDAERAKFVKDNYQFVLQVKQKTDIIMFLIQPDGRLYRGEKYPYKQLCNGINIMVFTLTGNQKTLDKFDQNKFTLPNLKFELKRETNYWHRFEPGRYAIVPCKMGNNIPQTQFEFRAYAQYPVNFKKVNGNVGEFKILPKYSKSDNPSALRSIADLLFKQK